MTHGTDNCGAGTVTVAIAKNNRALRRLLAWLAEGDLEVLIWRTEDDVPVLVSLVDTNADPAHAVTLQVTDTNEGQPSLSPE